MSAYDDARLAVLVIAYLGIESLRSKEVARGFGVSAVNLDPRNAVLVQVLFEFSRDTPDEVEPVSASKKSQRGFIVGDARREHTVDGDIGRVRRDDIELHAVERIKEITDRDMRA